MTCFVGLDVSMEETAFCIRDLEGRILGQGKIPTDPDAIAAALGNLQLVPNVLDAGAAPRGAQQFPAAASLRISLSSVRSATARRRRAFSVSSSLRRLT